MSNHRVMDSANWLHNPPSEESARLIFVEDVDSFADVQQVSPDQVAPYWTWEC